MTYEHAFPFFGLNSHVFVTFCSSDLCSFSLMPPGVVASCLHVGGVYASSAAAEVFPKLCVASLTSVAFLLAGTKCLAKAT